MRVAIVLLLLLLAAGSALASADDMAKLMEQQIIAQGISPAYFAAHFFLVSSSVSPDGNTLRARWY